MAMEARSHLRPTEQEAEMMREWFIASHQICGEKFPQHPPHDLKWSWELTKSAGNIRWSRKSRPVIRLSGIIFLDILRKQGDQKFAVELAQTLAHEYAHLHAGRDAGHGREWKHQMRVAGFPPRVKHPHPTLGEIIPKEIKALVPLGKMVFYVVDGDIYHGRVRRYNAKTVTIEKDSGRSWWRIPYRLIPEAIENANAIIEMAEKRYKKKGRKVTDRPRCPGCSIRLQQPIYSGQQKCSQCGMIWWWSELGDELSPSPPLPTYEKPYNQ